MEASDKQAENCRKQKGDQDRGDRMGIKHLKQLYVGCDYRYKIALVLSVKLCGTQAPERHEYPAPDKRKQLEGDKVIAGLLRIAQNSAHQSKHSSRYKQKCKRKRRFNSRNIDCGIAAEHCDEGRRKMSYKPHKNRESHISGKRLYKSDQPRHDLKSAAFFHDSVPSVP